MPDGNGRVAVGTLIFVMATFALDMFSTLTSSPQTTEINAMTRADTLMKWVKLADVVALAGGAAAWAITRKPAAIIGPVAVVAMMHYLYEHAKQKGLENDAPGTEDTAAPSSMLNPQVSIY